MSRSLRAALALCVCSACGRSTPGPDRAGSASSLSPVTAAPVTAAPEETPTAEPALPSISELRDRARSALPDSGLRSQLLAPLPATWPTVNAEVELFAYKSNSLPTGVARYELEGPTHRVSLKLPNGETRVASVIDGRFLGRPYDVPQPELDAAVQALLEVELGRRTAESARAALMDYSRWASALGPIGVDLRARKPEFFAWLEGKAP